MDGSGPTNPSDRDAPDSANAPTVRHSRHATAGGAADFRHGRFEPGVRLGDRYRIVGLLGQGGMGEVYRADDLELGQSVALKFLPQRVALDPAWLGRFRNEVRTAREVTHPNVCRIYDIGEQEGHVFLSMEYIDGEDLASVLRRLGRPSREKAIEIARQICLGLGAAHENGVLHRDLKPANIMIDGRGRVRITDFGLAGFLDELERVEARAGTPAYMAPEQLEHGKVSVRSDLYSLGLILYELLTGRFVYETDDLAELKRQQTDSRPSTPSSIVTDVDPAVERVVMRCLEPSPEDRPPSVYAVLGALPGGDPIAAALAAGETPSPEVVANASERGGLAPRVATALLTAVILLVLGLAFVNARTLVLPAKAPHVLSVEAAQVLEAAGYADPPLNTATGFEVNGRLKGGPDEEPRSKEQLESSRWPPPYGFWRRWSPGSLEPSDFHSPDIVRFDDPPQTLPGSASVMLDSTGRLVRLSIVPEPSLGPPSAADVDFSALLRLAGLDPSTAEPAEPAVPPPSYCDEYVAWSVAAPADDAQELVVQAGACKGRIVYFELVGLIEVISMPASGNPLWFVVFLIAIVVAWRNLRAGRGDRRGATRFAFVMLAVYLLIELLSMRIHEQSPFRHLQGLVWTRAGSHALLHAVHVWLMYVAIEPYVRRFWPRMLVAWVRLLNGRVRDPLVGREAFLGLAAGTAMATMGPLAVTLAGRLDLVTADPLPWQYGIFALNGPDATVIQTLYSISGSMLLVMLAATILLIGRLLTGRDWSASLVIVLLVSAVSLLMMQHLGLPIASLIAIAASRGIMLAIMLRVGLLATLMMLIVERMLWLAPISSDLTAWYGPYSIYIMLLVFGLAGFTFWVALAGQPLFKDVLVEARPARG
ncbi:MAG: serine/threonine-protein kinase [Planctomycetota bacterium]|jgi:serine/threonine-protein kinase